MLPGVYASAGNAMAVGTRIAAVPKWSPDAILVGSAAAAVSFWPTIRVRDVAVVVSGPRAPQPGFSFERGRIPVDLIEERYGLRFTTAALTALDLCPECGGDGIDTVLRTRAATLAMMHEALALTGRRRGNPDLSGLLLDSRDEPWSGAEREAHRLLRAAGIDGWVTNTEVRCSGRRYFIDIAFGDCQLAIEIDGRIHGTDPALFESDRGRQNHLMLDGWTVLRFTSAMLRDDPAGFIATVRSGLGLLNH